MTRNKGNNTAWHRSLTPVMCLLYWGSHLKKTPWTHEALNAFLGWKWKAFNWIHENLHWHNRIDNCFFNGEPQQQNKRKLQQLHGSITASDWSSVSSLIQSRRAPWHFHVMFTIVSDWWFVHEWKMCFLRYLLCKGSIIPPLTDFLLSLCPTAQTYHVWYWGNCCAEHFYDLGSTFSLLIKLRIAFFFVNWLTILMCKTVKNVHNKMSLMSWKNQWTLIRYLLYYYKKTWKKYI